jgi:predicted kinase
MEQDQLRQDLARLKESLGPLPEPVAHSVFVVVSGLPGTGKSFFSRKLAERQPFYIIESDAMRKVLFSSPSYNPDESARLFAACHLLMDWLLKNGVPVIFDATNLSERHRAHLYRISDRTGARLILVRVEAPQAVAQQRLQSRKGTDNPEDKSDADWEVYRMMKSRVDNLQRNHFAVDTSRDITPVIDKIMRLINR